MSTWDVIIHYGTIEHHVVVQARHSEEAMNQALEVTHLNVQKVDRMSAKERS